MLYFDIMEMTQEERKILYIMLGIMLIVIIVGYAIKYFFKEEK